MKIDETRRFLAMQVPGLLAAGVLAGCAYRPGVPGVLGGGAAAGAAAQAGRAPPREIEAVRADAPLPEALRSLVAGPRRLDFLLLGEVHDHPLHHQLRAAWLTRLARSGRFAIAFEQFDADRQADLDKGRAAGLAGEALARAAGFQFRGWDWDNYAPLVALALRERLPLVAANLSAVKARAIARGTTSLAAGDVPPSWGPSERAKMVSAIANGHCGLLPERAVAGSVNAQLARDATIADALARARESTARPVVLIAGNGHVRRDIGVARHLAARAPGARIYCVGFLERDETPGERAGTPPFDLVVRTPPHERPDQCEELRRAMKPAPAVRR